MRRDTVLPGDMILDLDHSLSAINSAVDSNSASNEQYDDEEDDEDENSDAFQPKIEDHGD